MILSKNKVRQHIASAAMRLVLISSVIFLTCCKSATSEFDLLETVPADARFVATVNFEKILKNAGCKFNSGVITLSPNLEKICDNMGREQAKQIDAALLAAQTIDISRVVIFQVEKKSPIATFSITQNDIFNAMATTAAKNISQAENATVYEFDGYAVMTSGSQGWLAQDADDLSELAVNGGDRRFMLDITSGVVRFLNTPEAAMNVALNMEGIVAGGIQTEESMWLCTSVDVNNNILSTETSAMDYGGNEFDFSNKIELLDTDFLRYIPQNTQILFSVGKIKDLNSIAKVVEPFLSGAAASVLPYLNAIDGTTAFAASSTSGKAELTRFFPEDWEMTLITHLPQNITQSLTSMIGLYGSQLGTVEQTGNDEGSISINGTTINYGVCDGYFAASTLPVSANYNNSFTTDVEGFRAAIVIDVPYGSELMRSTGLPYGFNCRIGVGDTAVSGRMVFNGTGEPFLATVASIAASRL